MTNESRPGQRVSVPTRVLLGSFSADRLDPLHDLLRAARTGDESALCAVLDRARNAAVAPWPGVDGAVVVAVPAHLPGPANPLVVAVADAVADVDRWEHRRDALRRIRPGPEGKSADARDARDAWAEATTLVWAPAPGGTAIVLVDDVVRTGTTLAACLLAIRAAGDLRPVLAAVLAERRREPAGG